ncbi:MAG TPA: class I SAM-dependent methyltransferase [Mycobacterium sp.]|jgi:SAM-dependent methyltransferase|nr:class I SAM-dependent methyltransferase [Mycobacterium sp.]
MPQHSPAHTDRRRAESFGAAAVEYDRHRPRYPLPLIAGLVTRRGTRALDVGAGTGIAATQLADAGADVLAIEPDERMARVAAAKGIRVELSTFEEWQPAGRDFDLVVFAQSFHWVEPRAALQKVATILCPGGRLALLANRILPTAPTQQELDEINADYLDVTARSVVNAEDEVAVMIGECGFSVERRRCVEKLHYTTEDYLNLVSTYSNRLVLDASALAELRSRLARRIGTAGVDAQNNALAVVCTPTAAS